MTSKLNIPHMTLAAVAVLAIPAPAQAELTVSELIVELQPGTHAREDVEVWNNAPERSYVAVEPREIVDPASPSSRARRDPDPEELGLLASPERMVLEPGQRKLLRIASLSTDPSRERVYRVTVKPVVGGIPSDDSGLKILVGYDLLVLVRPAQPTPRVTASRSGRKLTFTNSGNVSVEIVDGRQCNADHAACSPLPGKRLYVGATWSVDLPSDLPAEYSLKSPGKTDRKIF